MNHTFIVLLFVGIFCTTQSPAKNIESVILSKLTYVENPNGVSLGFWANGGRQDLVVTNFGRRPISRAGFYGWSGYETSPGVYNFEGQFNLYKREHLAGSDVIGCANIAFSRMIGGDKHTIPPWFGETAKITDPEVRTAAKTYIYELVQAGLRSFGEFHLTFDYETPFNMGFFGTRTGAKFIEAVKNANDWGVWYVEAVAVARQAAADLNMSNNLKLLPIMNGNPFLNSVLQNGTSDLNKKENNQWLKNVIEVSDYLGFDTYHWTEPYAKDDPGAIFDVMEYWADWAQYAGGKKIFMTEMGFTSILTARPDIPKDEVKEAKYYGTEEQQATFFNRFFDGLYLRMQPEGTLYNKVKGVCFWCVEDNKVKEITSYEAYFGHLRYLDGSRKPSADVMRDGIRRFESDPLLQPSVLQSSTPVTFPMETENLFTLTDGLNYQTLLIEMEGAKHETHYNLNITTKHPGGIVITINGDTTLWDISMTNSFYIDITSYLHHISNTIEVIFTDVKFPFYQEISDVQIVSHAIDSLPKTLLHYPMDGEDIGTTVRDISGNNIVLVGDATSTAGLRYYDSERGWVRMFTNAITPQDNKANTAHPMPEVFGGNLPKTVCFWLKIDDSLPNNLDHGVFYQQVGSNPVLQKFALNLQGKTFSLNFIDGENAGTKFSANIDNPTAWNHIALVVEKLINGKNKCKFYINGEEKPLSSNNILVSPNNCSINTPTVHLKVGNKLSGWLSDFRVYSEDLVSLQLAKVMDGEYNDATSVNTTTLNSNAKTTVFYRNGMLLVNGLHEQTKLAIYSINGIKITATTLCPEKNVIFYHLAPGYYTLASNNFNTLTFNPVTFVVFE